MVGKNVPSRHGTACCCRRLRAGGCSANAYCAAGQALLSVPVPATQAAPPCAMRGARSLASAAPRSPTSRSPPPAPVAPAGARLASGLAAPPQPRRPALLPLLLYTLAAALLPVAAGRGGAPKPRVHIYDLPEALFPRSAEDSFTAVLRASKARARAVVAARRAVADVSPCPRPCPGVRSALKRPAQSSPAVLRGGPHEG